MNNENQQVEEYTSRIEKLRQEGVEFAHLADQIYLDHAANAIYTSSTIDAFKKKITAASHRDSSSSSWSLFSNPHSHSQSAQYTSMCIELTREKILRKLFNTNSSEYDLVFVHNATHALRLLAESFCFEDTVSDLNDDSGDDDQKAARFVYLSDNHTSVVGVREIVWQKRHRVDVYCLNESDDGSFTHNLINRPTELEMAHSCIDGTKKAQFNVNIG
jgi:molybdenum cofactor sulfurtransferase